MTCCVTLNEHTILVRNSAVKTAVTAVRSGSAQVDHRPFSPFVYSSCTASVNFSSGSTFLRMAVGRAQGERLRPPWRRRKITRQIDNGPIA